MNIDEHVEACLHFFESEVHILQEILFVGAWARYFYRNHFKETETYFPRLATKDLDILLNRSKKHGKRKVDVHESLVKSGYEPRFYQNGLIKYYRDHLELEFLLPAKGKPEETSVGINAYNLKAQELPHLQMLWRRPISVRYGHHNVNLPHPMDFALHKMIISYRRSEPEAAEQDCRDAEEVLYALSHRGGFEEDFMESLSELPRKSGALIRKGLDTILVPGLREKLKNLSAEGK